MQDIDTAAKLLEEKKFEEAREILEDVLKFFPYNPDAISLMGSCLFSMGNFSDALEYLKKTNTISPTPKTEGELGVCYYNLKDHLNAQAHLITSIMDEYNEQYAKTLEKSLLSFHNDSAMLGLKLLMHEQHPKDIYILRDITNYAQKLKNFDVALEFFKILLKLCPNDYVAWNNLGLIYEEIGEWEKSYDCYRRALSLNDFFSPNFNLGIMSRKLHKFEDSIEYLKKAVVQNPNSPQPKYSLAMSYMMLRDFKNGYPLYAKHMTKIMPTYYGNEWDGTPHPDKTLCIFTTGGLGDMIMFSRYFEYIKDMFREIYVLLPKTLHKLFSSNFPYIKVVDSSTYFTSYDYAITPMHILQLFNLDFNENVPYQESFMFADEELVKKYKEKLFNTDKIKIAINWHGNREGTRTFFNRSMPIENFEPIFEEYKDRAVFYSIQKDESHTECQKYPHVIDLYDEIQDFNDTAAILKNVDLLISIDSSPIHMAGSLGVKTFMVLPYSNEWRWFTEGETTIWYNSVELFRQTQEKDWNSAVQKVLEKMKTIY